MSTDGVICGEGWDFWEHSCYYFAVNERGTFAEVEEVCRQKGAYLASVASAEEQAYLKSKYFRHVRNNVLGYKQCSMCVLGL